MQDTIIYVKFVEECLKRGDDLIRYFIPITGHGLRKLMRALQAFKYVVHELPELTALFKFILKETGIDLKDLYETYNCGVGAAAIVPARRLGEVLEIAESLGYDAFNAGEVQPADDGLSSVVIKPIDVTFDASSLALR